MPEKEPFLTNRLKSVGYAFKGACYLIKTERSIKVQAIIGLLVTGAGFYFEISPTEWLFQIIFIGLVMATEGMNTALEYFADFVHPEHHKAIGRIKDLAAGAVFIAAMAAAIGALIIYIPKFF